ncbi:hypothetical protein [Paludifilum halophilum]|uniref:Uncharacterized protein n=1 Tax=Paludifilum halophilum TaxID=1642702 RepID=A0A235B3I3_9BACL|nr:hypothetical protein [Paludifilum halophilum]OYD06801.1 hypothetical protein CHM34_14710 [Paludifilum halophilum]
MQTWQPDTQALEMNQDQSYSFTVGYPSSISIGFTWKGDENVEMKGVGNKEDQFYYNYYYETNPFNGYNIAFYDDKPITVEYSGQYKSLGTLIGLWTRSGFLAEWRAYDDNVKWYSEWKTFIHDY